MIMFYRAKSRIGLYDLTKDYHWICDVIKGQVVFAIEKVTIDFGYKKAKNIICFNENYLLGYCFYDSKHWEQV